MHRKIIYLINPVSGTNEKAWIRELIERKTRKQGFDFEILSTRADGNYGFLGRRVQAEQITDVVVCGGDGTVNGVVQALLQVQVNIGILPVGSGNGLAFAAGIPRQLTRALDIVFKGKAYATDAFYINDRFSCMLCGIGFDARVAGEFAKRRRRGLKTYIRVAMLEFFRARPYPFEIRLKEGLIQTDAFFISIANSNQFGNHFTIAPRASLSDGLLDIVIVKKMSKLLLPFSILYQLSGTNARQSVSGYAKNKNILYLQTDRLSIRNPAAAPLHIDGDPAETCEAFDIRVLKGCFRLLRR
jgi:YegS/Rv2252/BmrU family lipid kinase